MQSDDLGKLESVGLIRLAQHEPELEYLFRHVLSQEAAYASLLKHDRRELHRRVGEALRASNPSRLDEIAPMLALHFTRAEMPREAFAFSKRAGDGARRTYAYQEAMAQYEQALDCAANVSDLTPEFLGEVRETFVGLGAVHELAGEPREAIAVYRRMMVYAERHNDAVMRADGLNHLNTTCIMSIGSQADSKPDTDRALGLAHETGDIVLIARALWNIGLGMRFSDPLGSLDYFRQVQALSETRPDPPMELRELAASCNLDSAIPCFTIGKFREALKFSRAAAVAFEALGYRNLFADALGGQALGHYWLGEAKAALDFAERAEAISRSIENPWGIVYSGWCKRELAVDRGDFEQIVTTAEERVEAAQKVGFPVFIGTVHGQICRALHALNRLDEALAHGLACRQALRSVSAPNWWNWGEGMLARVYISRGELAQAHELLDGWWSVGENPTLTFHGFIISGPSIAQLALVEGRLAFGIQFSDWLCGRFDEDGVVRFGGEMRLWRGRLHLANGDVEAARRDLSRAREQLLSCDAEFLVRQVDETLGALAAR